MALRLLRKLLRLPAAERTLLVRSVFLLGVARLALWVVPLSVVRRLLARTARPRAHSRQAPATGEQITWAIAQAQKVIPRATCLPQALAAEALLMREGHPVELRVGVIKTDSRRLVAHAWVESGGRIVVGDLHKGLSQFTPLPPLPGARP